MAKAISLTIDAPKIAGAIAKKTPTQANPKIIIFNYDHEMDTFYVHFRHPSKAIDSDIINQKGQIIIDLDGQSQPVNLTVMKAGPMRLLHQLLGVICHKGEAP